AGGRAEAPEALRPRDLRALPGLPRPHLPGRRGVVRQPGVPGLAAEGAAVAAGRIAGHHGNGVGRPSGTAAVERASFPRSGVLWRRLRIARRSPPAAFPALGSRSPPLASTGEDARSRDLRREPRSLPLGRR